MNLDFPSAIEHICYILVLLKHVLEFFLNTQKACKTPPNLFVLGVFADDQSCCRVFLICFAERGLVVQGRPNLRLFHQLYWIVFSVFIVTFPVLMFLRGNFAETTYGKICLQIPLEPDRVKWSSRSFSQPNGQTVHSATAFTDTAMFKF